MQELDDNALLREYAANNSESAFSTLIARHINKVYSTALRHTNNPHHAEEITQAVFIILATKANKLSRHPMLSGWLHQTARLAAITFLRGEIRRTRREQEACMQTLSDEIEPNLWSQLAPLLDSAIAGLGDKDRYAIVLRFFDGKSMKEIGDALGNNEDAAKVRVNRALEKLRKLFLKRGVDSTTAAIAETISNNSIQSAPAVLIKTTTAVALAKGATASLSAAAIAKATLFTMKVKSIVVTGAVVVVIGAGIGSFIFSHFFHSSPPAVAVPIKPANSDYVEFGAYLESVAVLGQQYPDLLDRVSKNYKDNRFLSEVDPDTRRTTNSPPSAHIKSLFTSSANGVADYLASLTSTNGALMANGYFHYDFTNGSPYLGKRIRLTGWIKTKDVVNWAAASLVVSDEAGHVYGCDPMSDRPISGTTDWQQIEIVTQLPDKPCFTYFGPSLYGAGEIWADDFQIDVVPDNTPITDDRIWHVWSPNPNDFSEVTDYKVTHDGHSSLCITYIPSGNAPKGSWMWWGQDIRATEKYAGHLVRMTVWTKTEIVGGSLRPNLRPKGANFKLLAQDKMLGASGRVNGTTDWAQQTIICNIPKGTWCLDTGFAFHGSGKVWIDMDSLKYEIIDNPNKPKLIR